MTTETFTRMNSGQFFSMITVLMVLPLFALSITFTEAMSGYGSEMGEHIRLKSGYHYYHSLDQDLGRAAVSIGERTTISAINHTVSTGEGLESPREGLEEIFTEGTLDGKQQPLVTDTMEGWINDIEEVPEQRGYGLEVDWQDLEVDMYDPWHISFRMDYHFQLEDRRNMFRLDKDLSKANPVSVKGREDPLVTIGTEGIFYQEVKACDFEELTTKVLHGQGSNSWSSGESLVLEEDADPGNIGESEEKILVKGSLEDEDVINDFAGAVLGELVDGEEVEKPYLVNETLDVDKFPNQTRVVVDGEEGGAWAVENLYRMWREACYIGGDNAPDFLDRLGNNLTVESEYGLNAFIRKGELEDAGVSVDGDRSNLAHIYFSDEDVENLRVKGMPDSFRIDSESAEKLDIDKPLTFN